MFAAACRATTNIWSSFFSGRAVGLVLGGGGARGFAHIGVIRALKEGGLQINAIGGTSMGAVIGAQCALGHDDVAMRSLNQRYWIRTNPFRDKTLPIVALLKCHRLHRMVTEMFGDIDIRELSRPFFCVSSDLTHARLHVHDCGPLARAVRASISLPGITIPVCDNGSVLVDGAVLNNLPADLMKKKCGGPVIAVNVTPGTTWPWTGHFRMQCPDGSRCFAGGRHVPHILDIMMRTTMLGSEHQQQSVTGSVDLLINPAIEEFGMFDWHRLDDIVEAGSQSSRKAVAQWNQR